MFPMTLSDDSRKRQRGWLVVFVLLTGAAPWLAAGPASRAWAGDAKEDAKAVDEGEAGKDDKSPWYEYGEASRDGIGKFYMGREISQVMGHLGAGWLERPEREREEQPAKVIELMALKADHVVADIGAGTGYFSFRIAPHVPEGKVLAVDIQQEMLDIMQRRAEELGVTNVEPVMGTITDPKLPEGGVDVVLLVDAYHEFDHPREMMEAIFKALRPGGRVVQVEYRGEDPTVPIKPLHKMTEAQAKKEMTAVGLVHKKTYGDLPQQHVMVFQKPADGEDGQTGEKPKPPEDEGPERPAERR